MRYESLIGETEQQLAEFRPVMDRLHALGVSKQRDMGNKSSQIVVTYPPLQTLDMFSGKLFHASSLAENTLYVHIPYCTQICTYCDYARTAASPQDKKIPTYLRLLEQESAMLRQAMGGEKIPVRSIYIGGGTPTLLTPEHLEYVLKLLHRDFTWQSGIEFSLEGSPETVTVEKITLSRSYGVNRVSIGVESFNDAILGQIRRRHTAEEAFAVLRTIREAGIENIDFDLIRGLPGYTLEMMVDDVRAVERAQTPSVTSYQYSVKPQSIDKNRIVRGKLTIDLDGISNILLHMVFVNGMRQLGYEQRPIDWFIKDSGHVYQHQVLKWEQMQNQLVLGQSAYGYMNGAQFANFRDRLAYERSIGEGKLPIEKATFLSAEEIMRRRFIFGLKTRIDRREFKETYGVDPLESPFGKAVIEFQQAGAIEITDSEIRLSKVGSFFADWIQMAFYSDEVKARGTALIK